MSAIIPDTYDKLFLRCNGVTTTFVDSSTANPKTITANGNATQLSIPEAFQGKRTAMFFNGTTDYVVVPSSADFAFGTGAFQFEAYFNTANPSTPQIIFEQRANSAYSDMVIATTGGKINLFTGTTTRIAGTTAIVANTWYKVKLVGNGGANGARTVIIYLALADGVYAQEGSTWTVDYNFSSNLMRIGASIEVPLSGLWNGWLKNLTIVKGTTTVLSMLGDSPANSPLGPAIAFDGTGDYLSLSSSSDFTPAGDFEIEGFFQFLGTGNQWLWSKGTGHNIGLYFSSNVLYAYTGGSSHAQTNLTPIIGKWYHLSVSRWGGYLRLWIDTNQLDAQSDSTSIGGTEAFYVGSDGTTGFNGYIREFRFSTVFRYTTTPHALSQTGFTVDANTVLYIKGDENNGVTTFVDSETTPKTITTNGDTKIKYTEDYRSCIFKDETGKFPYPVGSAKVDFFSAFGSGVGYFDGTTDYLDCDSSADFAFGTGSFTEEVFIRYNSIASYKIFLVSGGYDVGQRLMWHMGGYFEIYLLNTQYQKTWTPVVGTWYHLAVVRNVDNLMFFVNGTQVGTTDDITAKNIPQASLRIGADTGTADSHNGLMDNIRISKGIARYTATFNPPDDYDTPISNNKSQFFALL